MAGRRVRWGRLLARLFLGGVAVLLLLAILGALDGRGLPRRSSVVDRLAPREKARLAEALHLHRALGDSVWPGWSRQDLPVVLYNERFAFLVGLADPQPGWIKVPGRKVHGGPWQIVPGDSFAGAPYYRQPLPGPGEIPEAFTVRVGERWAASVPTYEWFRISLAAEIRRGLPAPLAAVFPFRLALRLLIGGVDGYVCIIEHEAFHAWQGSQAAERLAAAERATALEVGYPESQALEHEWSREAEPLARGALARSRAECLAQAREFLARRGQRRVLGHVAPALADYERRREWLEGLAKYAELECWRRAAGTPGYRPLAELAGDGDFRGYAGFEQKWRRELAQLRWARGDTRFYETGLAQAAMLDRLAPGWKARALAGDESLEELLAEAVSRE